MDDDSLSLPKKSCLYLNFTSNLQNFSFFGSGAAFRNQLLHLSIGLWVIDILFILHKVNLLLLVLKYIGTSVLIELVLVCTVSTTVSRNYLYTCFFIRKKFIRK